VIFAAISLPIEIDNKVSTNWIINLPSCELVTHLCGCTNMRVVSAFRLATNSRVRREFWLLSMIVYHMGVGVVPLSTCDST